MARFMKSHTRRPISCGSCAAKSTACQGDLPWHAVLSSESASRHVGRVAVSFKLKQELELAADHELVFGAGLHAVTRDAARRAVGQVREVDRDLRVVALQVVVDADGEFINVL